MANTRVKICGITREQDAFDVAALGGDAIGLVFYPKSPRYVADMGRARAIAQAAGPFVSVVGLFVNASSDDIDRILAGVPLSVLQFHGDESEQQCRQYHRPYIKALRMRDDMSVETQERLFPSALGFLLDTYVSGTPGGTGKAFDWHRVPKDSRVPLIVAGGLNDNNVAQAIALSQPYGVDVSGGVESEPGVKSKEKVAAFITQAKS